MNRRSFLQNSGFALSAFSLPNILEASNIPQAKSNKSVIWVWMGGGATHFETFNVNDEFVPDPYRSVIGNVYDPKTGIRMGGLFKELIKQADKLNVVASFSHNDAGHDQATQWMQTGHYQTDKSQTPVSKYPSYGSIVSNVFGPNNNVNGMPTYVTVQNISGDGPAWLGGAYKGFSPSAKKDLSPSVEMDRFSRRNDLLKGLNQKDIIGAKSLDSYHEQAYDVVLGDARFAFETEKSWGQKRELYGDSKFGENLLLAKQLVGKGSKFVTLTTGFGWDWHNDVLGQSEKHLPEFDKAIAGLVQDLYIDGMNEDVMVIVGTEFGRTKLNGGNNGTNQNTGKPGRDHAPGITPLLIFGGSYQSGRVIGKADKYNLAPEENKFGPIDLQATIFDHLSIDKRAQRLDNAGRPRYLLDGEAKNILT